MLACMMHVQILHLCALLCLKHFGLSLPLRMVSVGRMAESHEASSVAGGWALALTSALDWAKDKSTEAAKDKSTEAKTAPNQISSRKRRRDLENLWSVMRVWCKQQVMIGKKLNKMQKHEDVSF